MGIFAAGLIACASPAPGAPPAPAASATPADDTPGAGGHGEFLSRVFATGEVANIDPILAPGGASPHAHVFFGAENVMSTSTHSQLEAQPTSAQNQNDTAAYWVPELFFKGKRQMPGCTGAPLSMTCGTSPETTLYLRVYYTTTDPGDTVQMPPIMMVTGYPAATADPHLGDSTSLTRVSYNCGANNGAQIVTPLSQWPYTCTPYFQGPGSIFDGVVMIIDFPECWNGIASGTLNGERMVQYIDSNVPSGGCPNDLLCNDLEYANKNGSCPAGYHHIPRVSIHVHTKIVDPSSGGPINPSDCSKQQGFDGVTCTPGDESSTDLIALGLASDAGTPGGWYTLHADFVQSWQMGTVTDPFSFSPPPTQDPEQPCTLNDLTEDCLRAGVNCGLQPAGGVCTAN